MRNSEICQLNVTFNNQLYRNNNHRLLKLSAAEYVLRRVLLKLVCTSPTFKNIQKEMKEYHDVPFGCNSPTALLRRGQKSVILIWTVLVITSLPVHLFLNGVTGYSIQAFPVSGRVVSNQNNTFSPRPWENNITDILITDCANYLASAENWVTEFKNITIVVTEDANVHKYQEFINSWNSGSGETQGPPSPNELFACYMIPSTPICSVTIRWFPLVVTTIAMLIKTITVFLAIRKSDHFRYRLYNSLGDFIAVATRHREELSVPGECLANKGEWKRQGMRALKGGIRGIPLRAVYARRIWIRYLGTLDWIVWLFWVGSIACIWVLVEKSLATVRNNFRDEHSDEITNIFTLFSIAGFGRVSLAFIVSNSGGETAFEGEKAVGLPLQIALANSPQLWLSVGYLLWNNQITRIWGEHEWRSFAGRRKPPRVSYGTSERGVRNTRWLQLPYMLSAMLMVISTTMHWIVSQALFVVEVENQSGLPVVNGQAAPDAIIFAICYSPTAIFVIAVMAMALILGITIYYVIPFRSWMPFMAGSARVVFASCCALPKDLPADGVMWGDVSDEWGRLAGFGENAKGIQANEIYPERFKRTTPHPSQDSASDRPQTARTYASTARDSYFERPASSYTLSQEGYFTASPEETLRYPETASNTYSQPDYHYQGSEDLEPLVIPVTRQRGSTTSTIGSTQPFRPSTLSPDYARTLSQSSRRSPQTRRPREEDELGAGYRSDARGFRSRVSLHDQSTRSAYVSPVQERPLYETSEDNASDRDVKWKGWGVNPNTNVHDEEVSDSDHSAVELHEWKGWGVNP